MPNLRRSLCGVVLATVGLAGCAISERVASGGRSSADAVTGITYELTTAGTVPLLGGLFEVAPGPSILPAGQEEGAAPSDEGSNPSAAQTADYRGPRACRLDVQRLGAIARVRLTLYGVQGEADAPAAVEVYQLDLAAAEVPLILDDLNAAGFFGGQQRPAGGATIELRRGEEISTKAWTPEPRLDDLAERVYRNGRRLETPAARPGRAEVRAPA